MKRDERAAGDWHRRRHARHHVVVAAAVIRILVANGTNDRELVRGRGQLRNAFAELNSRNLRGDGFELAANFRRRIRLRIERLVMRRPAIHPDENAIDVPARQLRLWIGNDFARAQSQDIAEAKAQHAAQPKLDEIAPGHSIAVGMRAKHFLND